MSNYDMKYLIQTMLRMVEVVAISLLENLSHSPPCFFIKKKKKETKYPKQLKKPKHVGSWGATCEWPLPNAFVWAFLEQNN